MPSPRNGASSAAFPLTLIRSFYRPTGQIDMVADRHLARRTIDSTVARDLALYRPVRPFNRRMLGTSADSGIIVGID